jgi:hypothetical protein
MTVERKLRKIQDTIRNSGWRIQHIPWQPEGRLEYHIPKDGITWALVVSGFVCFFGPILLLGRGFSAWMVISLMVFGLVLLFASRFSFGRNLFYAFEAVEAACIDREILEVEDPDSIGSFNNNTFWVPRILCEFDYQGRRYRVTPIIVKIVAFNSEEGAKNFLDDKIDSKGKCTLWVNPKNPLHTVFHKKPKTGPYTV